MITLPRRAVVVLVLLALAGAKVCDLLLVRTGSPVAHGVDLSTTPGGGTIALAARGCSGATPYACDRVLQSRYGQFGNRSSAQWGMMYFVFLGAWYLAVGRPNHAGRYWHLVPLAVNTAGALLAVFLTYVMVSQLRAVCPMCMATHVINWAMLAIGLALWPRRPKVAVVAEPGPDDDDEPTPAPAIPGRPQWRPAAVALLFALTLSNFVSTRLERNFWHGQAQQAKAVMMQYGADTELVVAQYWREPVRSIAIGSDDAVRGPADAEHTVVVFSDFQCPVCKDFAVLSRGLLEQKKFSVRIVFKHFPLSPTCNPGAQVNLHAYACDAARAAEAARRVGGNDAFWRMHDQLFRAQDELDVAPYRDLARAAGIDADALEAEMDDPDTQTRIQADTLLGKLINVTSTPAILLDGRPVRSWQNRAFWTTVLSPSPATQPVTSPAADDK